MSAAPPVFDPEAVIDAMAPLLGLRIEDAFRPGIAVNLQATARFAAIVLEAAVEDEAEAAPVFVA